MPDVPSIKRGSHIPAAAGNILALVRAIQGANARATPLQREELCMVLAEASAKYRRWRAGEAEAVRCSVNAMGWKDSLSRPVLDALAAPRPSLPLPPIGVAHALLATTQAFCGAYVGAVQPLHVAFAPIGDAVLLAGRQTSPELPDVGWVSRDTHGAFLLGHVAAIRYLTTHGVDRNTDRTLLNSRGMIGSFPDIDEGTPVSGPSLGLASAVGVLSTLCELRVPHDVAFTGRVDGLGGVHRVGDICPKLLAAVDAGLTQAFIPDTTPDDEIPPEANALVARVPSLEKTVQKLWSAERIQAGINRVRTTIGNMSRPTTEEANRERVLLTVVARSDPSGTYRRTDGQALGMEDGPILVLARSLQPAHIYAAYTVIEPDNDFSENVRALERELKEQNPGCTFHPAPLAEIRDPTDYEQVLPVFQRLTEQAKAAHPGAEFVVNITSGTPQMLLMWHWMVFNHLIDARLFQVRESRWVPPRESRVRPVAVSL